MKNMTYEQRIMEVAKRKEDWTLINISNQIKKAVRNGQTSTKVQMTTTLGHFEWLECMGFKVVRDNKSWYTISW